MKQEEMISIRSMQRYLKEHLMDDVSMGELSHVSFYSPWHSYRIFKELVGISPGTYLRRLKLSSSALELRDEKLKIIDIAYKYGYKSVDGYQRSFKKEFGINPREYAHNPLPISLFIPYEIELPKKEKKAMKTKNIFISVIEKPERLLVYKPGKEGCDEYMSYSNSVGCDIWGILKSIKCIGDEPVCLYLPKKLIKKGESSYIQGVEEPLDYKGKIPVGFKTMILPRSTYLVFQGEKFKEEDYETAITELKTAIDTYNPKILGFVWDDDNPRIQLEPLGDRGYIELKAVKKI